MATKRGTSGFAVGGQVGASSTDEQLVAYGRTVLREMLSGKCPRSWGEASMAVLLYEISRRLDEREHKG